MPEVLKKEGENVAVYELTKLNHSLVNLLPYFNYFRTPDELETFLSSDKDIDTYDYDYNLTKRFFYTIFTQHASDVSLTPEESEILYKTYFQTTKSTNGVEITEIIDTPENTEHTEDIEHSERVEHEKRVEQIKQLDNGKHKKRVGYEKQPEHNKDVFEDEDNFSTTSSILELSTLGEMTSKSVKNHKTQLRPYDINDVYKKKENILALLANEKQKRAVVDKKIIITSFFKKHNLDFDADYFNAVDEKNKLIITQENIDDWYEQITDLDKRKKNSINISLLAITIFTTGIEKLAAYLNIVELSDITSEFKNNSLSTNIISTKEYLDECISSYVPQQNPLFDYGIFVGSYYLKRKFGIDINGIV
ncbi:putative viral membrane formation protein [Diachasmimorpha longicaudata entomopoxvirus]|uniref:Putative viral membrane formation protein n=1 Tax=Diachasmimorpha longicaudata entomopoxvirus TaxID=109981 RepID=A0A7R5WK51_9POXV|nr:putative viral membrane formation protein [Diachasmimorpha longicaudata entomopoxvirus]AKS26401.1 putative viral membrane formation protein [Diachasmimorpha longicaudata entomopoxvirus]